MHSIHGSSRASNYLASIAVAFLLVACVNKESDKPGLEQTREEQEKVVREAGEMLIAEIAKTFKEPPSDDELIASFAKYRQDYVGIAKYIEQHPDFARFNRNNDPPDYRTLSGQRGPISSMDPEIAGRLLKGTMPAIIDGNLSDNSLHRVVDFVIFRSGTVASGMSKGIAYFQASAPGAMVESLDGLRVIPPSPNREEAGCAYRRIEDHWYLYVCT